MIVNGDRQHLLGTLLTDHVLVENLLDLLRLRQLVAARLAGVFELFANDVVTEFDALIADEYGGSRDQLADFVLAFAAKRTVEEFAILVLTAVFVTHAGRS